MSYAALTLASLCLMPQIPDVCAVSIPSCLASTSIFPFLLPTPPPSSTHSHYPLPLSTMGFMSLFTRTKSKVFRAKTLEQRQVNFCLPIFRLPYS